jgi:hypothetical protein
MGGLQLVLSKTNRIGDTKYNIIVENGPKMTSDENWGKFDGHDMTSEAFEGPTNLLWLHNGNFFKASR